jgi:tetratricopeptide (TPR) repeat protein
VDAALNMLWTIIKRMARKSAGKRGVAARDDLLRTGIDCYNSGDFAAACRHLSAALDSAPDDPDALYYLALAEARSGRLERAEELLEAARARRDDADVHNALGNVYRLGGRLVEAEASYRRALVVNAEHIAALTNLGLCLRDQGVPAQALPFLDRALAVAPDYVEALFNKALALIDMGAIEPAYALIERALACEPDFAQAHLQRGFLLLRRGDFAAGWREYAWRVRIPDLDRWRDYPYPLWQGETLAGRRVLVQAEQGLGDQIMFGSCLPELVSRAQHTVIECDPRLAGLFARSFPAAKIYRYRVKGKPEWSREPIPDFRVRYGDLPRMLRNRSADFPPHGGYLVPDTTRVAAWRAQLAKLGPGLKIGVSWRGGTPGTGQSARSMPLVKLLPLLTLPNAHFISLQYGPGTGEIADLHARHGIALHEWLRPIADMDEVAALITSVDLVVAVCTTVVHVSGALGKTAWVMVPAVAEWRYLESGSHIPWYPALRLFRQRDLNVWDDVISTIRAELQHRVAIAGASA